MLPDAEKCQETQPIWTDEQVGVLGMRNGPGSRLVESNGIFQERGRWFVVSRDGETSKPDPRVLVPR